MARGAHRGLVLAGALLAASLVAAPAGAVTATVSSDQVAGTLADPVAALADSTAPLADPVAVLADSTAPLADPVAALADSTAPLADYTTGPYADRLCPVTAAAGLACGVGRTVLAADQGARHRERAVADGATCEHLSALWVCFEVRSLLVQRGGTTYGDTFLTPEPRRALDDALVAHESEHTRQWRLFGPDLALLYLREGADACDNYFEQQAGLEAGGYDCS